MRRRPVAADNGETDTLVVDPHLWGSPDSLRLSSLGLKGRRAAAVSYEPATLVVNHHLRGAPGRRAAAVNGETDTLVVDSHHWGSPDSLQLNNLGKRNALFVGRGHAPADHVGFPLHLPSSTAPKPSPIVGSLPRTTVFRKPSPCGEGFLPFSLAFVGGLY